MRLFFVLFVAVFVACGGSANKSYYYSTVLPQYVFDTNAPTIIKADPWDLVSSYYTNIALLALKNRGFNNIYLDNQIDYSFARNVIFLRVSELMRPLDNYRYSFNARGTCNVINGVPYCSLDSNDGRLSDMIPSSIVYGVTFDWYDVYRQVRVLYVGGVLQTPSNESDDLKTYSELITNTVSRIDFRQPTYYLYAK